MTKTAGFSIAAMLWCATALPLHAQMGVSLLYNMSPDQNALVLATGGNFSRLIHGRPFQQEALLSHGGYQYATWYHNGADQDIYISRRHLSGNAWETIDTGYDMERGNEDWNSHNVIAMGISGDGRIHLSYDHHVDRLRYITTAPGFATAPDDEWSASGFSAERGALNAGGAAIPRVTYPRFTNVGDDLLFTYRDYGSGSGDVKIAEFDAESGLWSDTRYITRGRSTGQVYDDVNGNPSPNRNSYHNGFHVDRSGRLHTTWTWRERTQDGNHDILYAYSDDRGVTWKNNSGTAVGNDASPITLNTPGIEVVDLDRRQGFLNQQGQIVDRFGGVHVLAFHRTQGPVYTNSPFSDRSASEYHHYYRDPLTDEWDVRTLPSGVAVGSRPRISVDSSGNLFGLFTEGGDLVIAGSARNPGGYDDWQILRREQSRDYAGTPFVDNRRLLHDGVLSVYLQEEATSSHPTNPTGSPLHILEYNTVAPSVPLMRPEASDGSLRFRKSTGEVTGQGLGFVLNSSELNVGQSGNGSDPFDRAAVMVFQLPDLGSIEDPFRIASFEGFLTETVGSGGVGGDLYGIGRRETPDILNGDYFGQADTPDPSAVLLQDDLLSVGMSTDTTFATSAAGNKELIDFLNTQYAGGEGAGDYVFLRLNTDAETSQRWSIASGDADDEGHRPQLVYYADQGLFLDGDYNRDGVVDASDYTVWRDNLNAPAGTLPNDPNGGTIGEEQYATWLNNYGATLSQPVANVPEPNSMALIAIAVTIGLARVKAESRWGQCHR